MSDAMVTSSSAGSVGAAVVVLDLAVDSLDDCLHALIDLLPPELALDSVVSKLGHRADRGPDVVKHETAIVHERADGAGDGFSVFVRLERPTPTNDEAGWFQFVWVLVSDTETHPELPVALEFVELMESEAFRAEMASINNADAFCEAFARELDEELHFAHHIPEELRPTGKFAGGFVADIRRRLPHYASDFADGFTTKSLASVLFLFFACLAPAVAFGGLLSVLTDGTIGAMEMIIATALCGAIYALFSGQPLTILGSTGPVIIFMGILYSACERLEIPYLPSLAWVGLWTMIILIMMALLGTSSLIRFFTRFTDDTFAALISLIFVYEAIKDALSGFSVSSHGLEPGEQLPYDTALLSLLLSVGTFWVASALVRLRSSVYLRRGAREFLADFGPTIAILLMTGVALWLHPVALETLDIPETISTTSGRPWLVNPLETPKWVWGVSIVPAILVSILLYLDQNITVRLVNNREYKLKKGAGYHLDLAIVGVLVGVCSMFGLPWMVAATVRSLNHVRSLNKIERQGDREVVVGTVETRLTGLAVHLLVGASLSALAVLKLVPMSVLFGLFLFMGVASMRGNQLFERLEMAVMDPARYPPSSYLRAVPQSVVHKFTLLQTVALAVLWVVKTSAVGILFPVFIALLVPMRIGMARWFKPAHLALLDAEEAPEQEAFREVE